MTTNPFVYFDINKNDTNIGRIVMTLRADVVPLTAENFRVLCTGENGYGYAGTKFYNSIFCLYCTGGDFENNDGTGGYSISGEYFDDENFTLKHDAKGVLCMAVNDTPNTNKSTFHIMLCEKDYPSLDGHQVVFGKVTYGLSVLDELNCLDCCGPYGLSENTTITISASGELTAEEANAIADAAVAAATAVATDAEAVATSAAAELVAATTAVETAKTDADIATTAAATAVSLYNMGGTEEEIVEAESNVTATALAVEVALAAIVSAEEALMAAATAVTVAAKPVEDAAAVVAAAEAEASETLAASQVLVDGALD